MGLRFFLLNFKTIESTSTGAAASAQGEVKHVSSFLMIHHCALCPASQQQLVPLQTTVPELWIGIRTRVIKLLNLEKTFQDEAQPST